MKDFGKIYVRQIPFVSVIALIVFVVSEWPLTDLLSNGYRLLTMALIFVLTVAVVSAIFALIQIAFQKDRA